MKPRFRGKVSYALRAAKVKRNQKMDSKTKMEWLVKGAEVTFETAREICYREGN
jgi:hypothetical protein